MKLLALVIIVATATALGSSNSRTQSKPSADGITRIPVVFSGGYDTDPRDHGRPVILVASALGVAPEVFREAFSGVHPAGPGRGPTPEEARANKAALMSVLGKYGITNERLDEVSNFYRYRPGGGDLWKHQPAVANALVKNGTVTGFEIVSGGFGYSSVPQVSIPNVKGPATKVELSFGKELQTNGSISKIKIVDEKGS